MLIALPEAFIKFIGLYSPDIRLMNYFSRNRPDHGFEPIKMPGGFRCFFKKIESFLFPLKKHMTSRRFINRILPQMRNL